MTLSFARLRIHADVLRLAASTPATLRPFAVELFRPQTDFNHRVADVLEDAMWLARTPDRAARIETRLGPRVEAPTSVVNVRGGPKGWLVAWAKRAGLLGLEAALAEAMRGLTRTNRALVDALKAQAALPAPDAITGGIGLDPWFAAQADFYREAAALVDALGPAFADPRAAHARFGPAREAEVQGRWPSTEARAVCQVIAPGQPIDADAEVVIRVPADEVLAPGAKETFAALFAARPGVALAYGDTRFQDSGTARFKPGWSPEHLLAENYIGGCFAMTAAHARTLDPAAPAVAWLLSAPFREDQVARIPWVVSHRARSPDEGQVELEAVRHHVGPTAQVESRHGHRVVRIRPSGRPTVSILVPFKDKPELLEALWRSLNRFDAGLPFELILVDNQSRAPETFALLRTLTADPRVQSFTHDQPYNWSVINNAAAARARGELLLFANNDVAATHDGWLADLVGWAQRPRVGAVGARLLYSDGSIQHAGVVIGLKHLAGHPFARWRPEYGATAFGRPDLTRNWSAATGACLMVRRALFEDVGRLDERIAIVGNDIELCMRLRARGLRIVCAGDVVLTHLESQSRRGGSVPAEDERLERLAYADLLAQGDPYWHPQLSAEIGHGTIALGPNR